MTDIELLRRYQTCSFAHPLTCCDHQTMEVFEGERQCPLTKEIVQRGLKCPKCGILQSIDHPAVKLAIRYMDEAINNPVTARRLRESNALIEEACRKTLEDLKK